MDLFKSNIDDRVRENRNFRDVVYTGKHMQLVLMSIVPKSDIGREVHPDNDQFFRFVSGKGTVMIGEEERRVEPNDIVIIPAGMEHNIINSSDTEDLQLYTIYAPPHHQDGTVDKTNPASSAQPE